jgi:hypothetical protein
VYKRSVKTCHIHHVKHKDTFRWKWRYVRSDGRIQESAKSYPLYYECVMAARASGYEPQLKCA